MASPSSCLVLCVLLFLLSAYWYCVVSGVCYHEGKGVDKDDEKAVELWTKSAKQDNQVPRAYATQIMWCFGIFARVLRLTTECGSATRSDDQSV